MGVVHVFGRLESTNKGETVVGLPESNDNDETAEVIQLVVNKKIAHGVAPLPVFREIEAALVKNGADFSCPKMRSDYKILTYLVQGMMDRTTGKSSDRSMMLDVILDAFGYEEPVNTHETQELFGDLLGRLD